MSTTSGTERIVGRVKFFNSKKGYGFVRGDVFSPEEEQEDYFFHFRSIVPSSENYHVYLKTNEYVEFSLDSVENPDPTKRVVATDITGLNRGPLQMDIPRRVSTRPPSTTHE